MKKTFTKAPLNDIESKYKVVLESDSCEPFGFASRQQQHSLIRSIVDNYGMMECGPIWFQQLRMFHDGSKWIIEMEAVSA